MKTYPLYDKVANKNAVGVATGEFREPKQGEWYISGAEPECYRAANDMKIKFNIVKLVNK